MSDKTFGQRIRELRFLKGVALRDLAARIGRDFTYLSKIENDRVLPPSAEVIVALAAHLDGDPEELAVLGNKPPIAVVRRQLAEARAANAALEGEVGRLRDALIVARRWMFVDPAPSRYPECEQARDLVEAVLAAAAREEPQGRLPDTGMMGVSDDDDAVG